MLMVCDPVKEDSLTQRVVGKHTGPWSRQYKLLVACCRDGHKGVVSFAFAILDDDDIYSLYVKNVLWPNMEYQGF